MHRTSSSSGVNVEKMEASRDLSSHRRWRDRVASHTARFRSASRKGLPKGVSEQFVQHEVNGNSQNVRTMATTLSAHYPRIFGV